MAERRFQSVNNNIVIVDPSRPWTLSWRKSAVPTGPFPYSDSARPTGSFPWRDSAIPIETFPRSDAAGPPGPFLWRESAGPTSPFPCSNSAEPPGPIYWRESDVPPGPFPRRNPAGPIGPFPCSDSAGPTGPFPWRDSAGPTGPFPWRDSAGPSGRVPWNDSAGPTRPFPWRDATGPTEPFPWKDSAGTTRPFPCSSSAGPTGPFTLRNSAIYNSSISGISPWRASAKPTARFLWRNSADILASRNNKKGCKLVRKAKHQQAKLAIQNKNLNISSTYLPTNLEHNVKRLAQLKTQDSGSANPNNFLLPIHIDENPPPLIMPETNTKMNDHQPLSVNLSPLAHNFEQLIAYPVSDPLPLEQPNQLPLFCHVSENGTTNLKNENSEHSVAPAEKSWSIPNNTQLKIVLSNIYESKMKELIIKDKTKSEACDKKPVSIEFYQKSSKINTSENDSQANEIRKKKTTDNILTNIKSLQQNSEVVETTPSDAIKKESTENEIKNDIAINNKRLVPETKKDYTTEESKIEKSINTIKPFLNYKYANANGNIQRQSQCTTKRKNSKDNLENSKNKNYGDHKNKKSKQTPPNEDIKISKESVSTSNSAKCDKQTSKKQANKHNNKIKKDENKYSTPPKRQTEVIEKSFESQDDFVHEKKKNDKTKDRNKPSAKDRLSETKNNKSKVHKLNFKSSEKLYSKTKNDKVSNSSKSVVQTDHNCKTNNTLSQVEKDNNFRIPKYNETVCEKIPEVRENVIINVKKRDNNERQELTTEAENKTEFEKKTKKFKKIKLFIQVISDNIQSSDTDDNMEDNNNENNTAEFSNEDLSFLDDLNVDEIINSLNCSSNDIEGKKSSNFIDLSVLLSDDDNSIASTVHLEELSDVPNDYLKENMIETEKEALDAVKDNSDVKVHRTSSQENLMPFNNIKRETPNMLTDDNSILLEIDNSIQKEVLEKLNENKTIHIRDSTSHDSINNTIGFCYKPSNEKGNVLEKKRLETGIEESTSSVSKIKQEQLAEHNEPKETIVTKLVKDCLTESFKVNLNFQNCSEVIMSDGSVSKIKDEEESDLLTPNIDMHLKSIQPEVLSNETLKAGLRMENTHESTNTIKTECKGIDKVTKESSGELQINIPVHAIEYHTDIQSTDQDVLSFNNIESKTDTESLLNNNNNQTILSQSKECKKTDVNVEMTIDTTRVQNIPAKSQTPTIEDTNKLNRTQIINSISKVERKNCVDFKSNKQVVNDKKSRVKDLTNEGNNLVLTKDTKENNCVDRNNKGIGKTNYTDNFPIQSRSKNLSPIRTPASNVPKQDLTVFKNKCVNEIDKEISKYLKEPVSSSSIIHRGVYSDILLLTNPKGDKWVLKKYRNPSYKYEEEISKKIFQKYVHNKSLKKMLFLSNFVIQKTWCYLMEYYPKNLQQALRDSPEAFHIDDVRYFSRQLVSAATILRRNKLIHSDINPRHILLNSTNKQLKLCGFDHAYYEDPHILLGAGIGMINYRAPEIILGYSSGYSIDAWAIGLLMYEMSTKRMLFPTVFNNNNLLLKQMSAIEYIPDDMIMQSKYKEIHFQANIFKHVLKPMKRIYNLIGPQDIIYNSKIVNTIQRAQLRGLSKKEKLKTLPKLENFIALLNKLLMIHPRYRMPIEFAYSEPFLIGI